MIGVAPGANLRLSSGRRRSTCLSRCFARTMCCWSSLEIPVETAIRALRRGFDAGMLTILNPAPAPALSESGVKELLSAAVDDHAEPRRGPGAGRHGHRSGDRARLAGLWPFACRQMGPAAVVITLGSRGCQVDRPPKPWSVVPAPRVEAVDTVGAGDAFNGALAVALAEGRRRLRPRLSPGRTPPRRWPSPSPVPSRLCRFATPSTDLAARTSAS